MNYSSITYFPEKRLFQRASYIEDGWYIKEVFDADGDMTYNLYEIPLYGGKVGLQSKHHCFSAAFEAAMELM